MHLHGGEFSIQTSGTWKTNGKSRYTGARWDKMSGVIIGVIQKYKEI